MGGGVKIPRLLSLKSPSPAPFDAAKGAGGLPTRWRVLPWGDNATAKGSVILNERSVRDFPATQRAYNYDRVPLDFDHNTVQSSPTYKGEPAKIAANVTLELVPHDGLYLSVVNWTPEGREYAGGGHYGDVSPVVLIDEETNEVIGCQSVALCRQGATPDVVFLSAPHPTHPTQTMKLTLAQKKALKIALSATPDATPQSGDDFLSAVRKALGLGNDKTPTEVLQALQALMAEEAGEGETETKALSTTLLSAPGVMDEFRKLLSAELTPIKDELKTNRETTIALSATQEQRERTEIESSAAREGKVLTPFMKTLSVPQLREIVKELPVTVPLSARTPAEGTVLLHMERNTGDAMPSDIQSNLGLSKEDLEKYGK